MASMWQSWTNEKYRWATKDTERNTRCAGIWRRRVDARRPGYQSAAESAYYHEYVDAAAVWGAEGGERRSGTLCARTAIVALAAKTARTMGEKPNCHIWTSRKLGVVKKAHTSLNTFRYVRKWNSLMLNRSIVTIGHSSAFATNFHCVKKAQIHVRP